MWLTLDQLARLDKSPWPETIPEQVDHPMWGIFRSRVEPIFVVCSTPRACDGGKAAAQAHSCSPFQPRWVFEKNPRNGESRVGRVRRSTQAAYSLRQHQSPRPCSDATATTRDANTSNTSFPMTIIAETGCPFAKLAPRASPLRSKTGSKRHEPRSSLARRQNSRSTPAILQLLSDARQAIELQHDAAGKVHHFHTHPVDEILVIISGRLNFMWEGRRAASAVPAIPSFCQPATLHQSEALDDSIYCDRDASARGTGAAIETTGRVCQDNGGSTPPGARCRVARETFRPVR